MTATFITAPQILDPNTILLNGNYYRIKEPIQVTISNQLPPKYVIGDYGKDDNAYISTISINSLNGGWGLLRYRYQDGQLLDADKFWTGENINGMFQNAITLGPLATSISKPITTFAGHTIAQFGDHLLVTYGRELFQYTTAWDEPQQDTFPGSGAVTDATYFNSRLFYALYSDGYTYLTSATGTGTDVGTGAGNPTAGVQSFEVWDGRLWAISTTGILYYSQTGNDASWSTAATLPVENVGKMMLKVFDNSDGQPVLWCITRTGPWQYDAVVNKWYQLRFRWPVHNGGGVHGRGFGDVFDNAFFVMAAPPNVYRLMLGGNTLAVEEVSNGHPDSVPSGFAGLENLHIRATDKLLFMTAWDTAGDVFVMGRARDGGWQPLYTNTAASAQASVPFWCNILGSLNGSTTNQRLYFFDDSNDGTSVPIVRWIDVTKLAFTPLNTTAAQEYASSGVFELPIFDGSYESQQKIALAVRIKVTGASANETVQVAYRIDSPNGVGGAYTNLGSAITAQTEQTLFFGSNNEGVAFKSIQLRATLARGSTATNAPKIEYIALDFVRVPQALRGFGVTVDATLDSGGKSPGEQITNIWSTVTETTLVQFAYRDDTGATRDYLVRVMAPEGIESTGHQETGIYNLRLVEMNG